MSKFKFGDKVWHHEFKLGVVLYKDETCDNDYMIYFERDDYHTTREDCELTKVSEWIQCSERMPGKFVDVLTWGARKGYIEIEYTYFDAVENLHYWSATNDFHDVTHWMPLPEMPEVKE